MSWLKEAELSVANGRVEALAGQLGRIHDKLSRMETRIQRLEGEVSKGQYVKDSGGRYVQIKDVLSALLDKLELVLESPNPQPNCIIKDKTNER